LGANACFEGGTSQLICVALHGGNGSISGLLADSRLRPRPATQLNFRRGPLIGRSRRSHFDPSMFAILSSPDVDPSIHAERLL
jgi:hypothetical protein